MEHPSVTQGTDGPRSGAPALGGLVPRGVVPSQRCTARSSRTGEPCKRWAIVGGVVCTTHGGSAAQVREAARQRLLSFVPAAIQNLTELALHAESEAARVRATIDLLDRAGLKVADEHVLIPSDTTNEALDSRISAALAERAGSGGQVDEEPAPDGSGATEPADLEDPTGDIIGPLD